MITVPAVLISDLIDSGEAELTTGPFGTQLKAGEYVPAGVPLINVRNVGFGDVREGDLAHLSDETARRLGRHRLEEGDIVFGRKGAVERHAYITQDEVGWIQGSDCIRLRLKSPRFLPRFVSYVFLTEHHMEWMKNHCSGAATMASLNQDILGRIALPQIALRTQVKIAAILSGYGDLIKNNNRRIVILDEVIRRIYRDWFVDCRSSSVKDGSFVDSEAGSIPIGWSVGSIGDHADVIRGRSYRGIDLVEDGGVPFINLKCVARDGGFRRDGLKRYIGDSKLAQRATAGDMVMAVTDMTPERRIVARVARIPDLGEEFGVFSMDLVKIVPKDLPVEYLYAALAYSEFPDRVKGQANGANVLHLHVDRITQYRSVIAAPADATAFAEAVRPIWRFMDVLENTNERLREIRDLVLPQLVAGKVDVANIAVTLRVAAA